MLNGSDPDAKILLRDTIYNFVKEIGDATKVNKEIPYMQAHGDNDSIVPYELGKLIPYLLRGMLPNYEFKLYTGLGHKTKGRSHSIKKKKSVNFHTFGPDPPPKKCET